VLQSGTRGNSGTSGKGREVVNFSETPAEFFNQFEHAVAFVKIAPGDTWCARHWAPCPLLHMNGIQAATMLMHTYIQELLPLGELRKKHGEVTKELLNAEMRKAGKICCTLGDIRMFQLWMQCPPSLVKFGGPGRNN
jgi:hypothetical protein